MLYYSNEKIPMNHMHNIHQKIRSVSHIFQVVEGGGLRRTPVGMMWACEMPW